MQRSSTWIIKSLWGACERWSKSDCIDLSAAFAYYTLQSFFPILLISLSIASWFLGKQDGLDQQIILVAAQILPPSVVELVETTLFKLITKEEEPNKGEILIGDTGYNCPNCYMTRNQRNF